MKPKLSAAFFDIDGTLVSPRIHHITDDLYSELQRLRDKGVKLVVSSGRPRHLVDNLAGFPFDAMVTHNGCVVWEGDDILEKHPLDRASVISLAGMCKEKDKLMICHTIDTTWLSGENELTRWFVSHHGLRQPEIADVAELAESRDLFEFSLFLSVEEENEFLSPIKDRLMFLRWHPAFTDVLPKGVDKGLGVASLLKRWGIDPSEAMAFGDGGNDVPMFKVCGTGVAMGDASEDVKAAADYVTTGVDDEGIIAAFRHFGI